MSTKVKRGKQEFLVHHGLIKLIVSNSLRKLRHRDPCVDFVDMEKQDFLEMQVEMMQLSQEKEEEEKVGKDKRVIQPRYFRKKGKTKLKI
jgi:hypothetical protein